MRTKETWRTVKMQELMADIAERSEKEGGGRALSRSLGLSKNAINHWRAKHEHAEPDKADEVLTRLGYRVRVIDGTRAIEQLVSRKEHTK